MTLSAVPDVLSIDEQEPCPQLFGRRDELEVVVQGILSGQAVVIGGGPGFGKSALAIAALYDQNVVERYRRRRLFISLDAASDTRSLLAKLVDALGLPSTGDEPSLLRLLEMNVGQAPTVAVLDNAETVLDGHRAEAERLIRLMAQRPGLTIVLTTRGLAPTVPNGIVIHDLPQLDPSASKEAFLAVSGAHLKDDPDLVPLAEALEGHALSIQLVAAQATGLPRLEGIRERWEEERANILRDPDEKESRLTSVRASLALSLQSPLLSKTPLAGRLLAILSSLPAGIEADDVRLLLGERATVSKARAAEATGALYRLKLIERRLDDRLRMLTPLRECVKMDVSMMAADRRRLLKRYLLIAKEANTVGTSKWSAHKARVSAEADNLDPICNMAVRSSGDETLINSLIGLGNLVRLGGMGGSSSLEVAAEKFRRSHRAQEASVVYGHLGRIALDRLAFREAKDLFQKALQLAEDSKSEHEMANCMYSLAIISLHQSDATDANEKLRKALQLYENTHDRVGVGNALQGLAELETHKEDPTNATATFKDAIKSYEQENNYVLGKANSLIKMARLNRETAELTLREALAAYQITGVKKSEAICLLEFGDLEARRGSYETADAYYEQAKDLCAQAGEVPGEANAWVRQAQLQHQRCPGSGRMLAETGFRLWFSALADDDLTRPGWDCLRQSLLSNDVTESHSARDAAAARWAAIARYDLIRHWVLFP